MKHFTFSQACEYLAITPKQLKDLREAGLIACQESGINQIYTRESLELTQHLLELGNARDWKLATLAWYADLLFAAEIGRALLLPINENTHAAARVCWLETPYATAVLDDLRADSQQTDTVIAPSLRSLIALAVGASRFWTTLDELQQSPLHPIVYYLESLGIPIVGQAEAHARDVGPIFAAMLYAFDRLTKPISSEFAALVAQIQRPADTRFDIPLDEQNLPLLPTHVPIDKLYAGKVTEIHSPPATWDFKLGVLRADRRTVAIELKVSPDSTTAIIDNILDMIRPFLGVFGARVVQILYEVAADPPYYRMPVIMVDTNEMLDRLTLKRDKDGFHRSKNRERLRDALNAAHSLEIVGEYSTWEDGRQVRKTFRRSVISIVGATFDAEETASLSTSELHTRGLPKNLQIRLNYYDGIRRPDGRLGDSFVLVPRLNTTSKLVKANYASTQELLKSFILFRYRQAHVDNRELLITRQTALERANIRNKNARMATSTLRKALDGLVATGILDSYSTPLPTKPHESLTVILSETAIDMAPEE